MNGRWTSTAMRVLRIKLDFLKFFSDLRIIHLQLYSCSFCHPEVYSFYHDFITVGPYFRSSSWHLPYLGCQKYLMASKQSSAKVVCPDKQPNCNFLAGQAWRASESVLGTCQFALTGVSDHACSKNQIFRDGIPHFILVFRIYIPTNSIPRRSECKASLASGYLISSMAVAVLGSCQRNPIFDGQPKSKRRPFCQRRALCHGGKAADHESCCVYLTSFDQLTIDCGHTSRFLTRLIHSEFITTFK